MREIDLTNQTFGDLTAIAKATNGGRAIRWTCRCACGNQAVVFSCHLRKGHSTSCGCKSIKHKGVGTRLYRIWNGARNRCNNPNNPDYPIYGGRGITFSPEWDDFTKFRNWAIENGYKKELSIDRTNNDTGYSPDNCQWSSNIEQGQNRSTNVLDGDTVSTIKTLAKYGAKTKEIADSLNLKIATVHSVTKNNRWANISPLPC